MGERVRVCVFMRARAHSHFQHSRFLATEKHTKYTSHIVQAIARTHIQTITLHKMNKEKKATNDSHRERETKDYKRLNRHMLRVCAVYFMLRCKCVM